MTQHSSADPVPEQGDASLPGTSWLVDADVQVPWSPPPGCYYQELLREVIDPELGVNIVDLGLVYDVRVADGVARIRMTLTTPGCPLSAYFDDAVSTSLSGAPGVNDTEVEIVWDPPWSPDMMSDAGKAQLGWQR